jgi:hypothetical protein
MDEMLPWGLTLAQTGVLCGGLALVVVAWVVVVNAFQIAKTLALVLLAIGLGIVFCGLAIVVGLQLAG